MTPTDMLPASSARAILIAVVASALAALIWVALAWRTPTSTYHFAPLVVALAGPMVAKQRFMPSSFAAALPLVGSALAIAATALLVLGLGDKLRGPTFWSSDGAMIEAVLFSGIGAVVALGLLTIGAQAGRAT